MKKKPVKIILFLFIASIVYLNCFIQAKNENDKRITEIGQTDTALSIVISVVQISDEQIYDILDQTLQAFHANLYCFDTEEKKGIYTKYVLIHNRAVFNSSLLKKGHYFEEHEIAGDAFLSTLDTGEQNQIGVIHKFDRKMNFQIRTLKYYVANHNNAFQKTFTLQLENPEQFTSFQESLNENGIYVKTTQTASGSLTILEYMNGIIYLFAIVFMLLIFYEIIKSYKQLGVEKLMGYDTVAIWASWVSPLVLLELAVFFGVLAVSSLFLFRTVNVLVLSFLWKVTCYYIKFTVLTLIFATLPFIYVYFIPVNAVLKNQKPLKTISIFNYLIKIIVTTIMLFVFTLSYTELEQMISQKNDRFHDWDKIKDYSYIYLLSYTDENFNSSSDENMKKWEKLYLDWNQKGGIWADFSSYSSKYEEEKSKTKFPNYCDVTVNPNYLKLFTVKDENGKAIQISEQESDYVILVPEKYKSKEKEIIKYFTVHKNGYSGSDGKKMKKEKIKIIWMENNQELFSCALDVAPDYYNRVKDPLVHVMTQENSVTADYYNVAGSRECPFKIKIEDSFNAQEEIDRECSKYFDLQTISFLSVTISQSINDQITMADEKLKVYAALIAVLILMGISITIQSIVAHIEQKQKILAIKKYMGYRLFDKYQIYFLCLCIGYIISGGIVFCIKKDIVVLIFAAGLLCLDFLFSIVYLWVQDRKNVIRITKGG